MVKVRWGQYVVQDWGATNCSEGEAVSTIVECEDSFAKYKATCGSTGDGPDVLQWGGPFGCRVHDLGFMEFQFNSNIHGGAVEAHAVVCKLDARLKAPLCYQADADNLVAVSDNNERSYSGLSYFIAHVVDSPYGADPCDTACKDRGGLDAQLVSCIFDEAHYNWLVGTILGGSRSAFIGYMETSGDQEPTRGWAWSSGCHGYVRWRPENAILDKPSGSSEYCAAILYDWLGAPNSVVDIPCLGDEAVRWYPADCLCEVSGPGPAGLDPEPLRDIAVGFVSGQRSGANDIRLQWDQYIVQGWGEPNCSEGEAVATIEDCDEALETYRAACGSTDEHNEGPQVGQSNAPSGCYIDGNGFMMDFMFNIVPGRGRRHGCAVVCKLSAPVTSLRCYGATEEDLGPSCNSTTMSELQHRTYNGVSYFVASVTTSPYGTERCDAACKDEGGAHAQLVSCILDKAHYDWLVHDILGDCQSAFVAYKRGTSSLSPSVGWTWGSSCGGYVLWGPGQPDNWLESEYCSAILHDWLPAKNSMADIPCVADTVKAWYPANCLCEGAKEADTQGLGSRDSRPVDLREPQVPSNATGRLGSTTDAGMLQPSGIQANVVGALLVTLVISCCCACIFFRRCCIRRSKGQLWERLPVSATAVNLHGTATLGRPVDETWLECADGVQIVTPLSVCQGGVSDSGWSRRTLAL